MQGVCHSGTSTSDSVRDGAQQMYPPEARGDLIERRSQGRRRVGLTEKTPDDADLNWTDSGEHRTRVWQEAFDVNLGPRAAPRLMGWWEVPTGWEGTARSERRVVVQGSARVR